MEPKPLEREPQELQDIAQRFHREGARVSPEDFATIAKYAGPIVVRMLSPRWNHVVRNCGLELENVFADALARLWQYRKGYDPSHASITAYLYAIARHIIVDRLVESRKASEAALASQSSENSIDFDNREAEASTSAGESPVLSDLEKILAKWPALDRELILAWASEDDPQWATSFAKTNKWSANRVRVRRLRLLRKLRSELANYGHSLPSGKIEHGK